MTFHLELPDEDERVVAELAAELDITWGEVGHRAVRLLGVVYALHTSVHGVVRPVGDPRERGA